MAIFGKRTQKVKYKRKNIKGFCSLRLKRQNYIILLIIMMFDDLDETQERLISQVRVACKALKYIRSVNPSDIRSEDRFSSRNGKYIKWYQQMTIVSDAQTEIEDTGKCLRAEVSDEQYNKNIEWIQLEKELGRKRKQYNRKQQKTIAP